MNQKMYRASGPMKKTGIEMPTIARPIALRSMRERGRRAERMPIGIPTINQTIAAPIASCIVTNIRPKTMFLSGVREVNDRPRPGQPYLSPVKKCHVKVPNCW